MMVAEMEAFRKRLDEKNVPWWDESSSDINRTHFEHDGKRWSAINGHGTYGGYVYGEPNQGLLEIWDGEEEPIGYLTAGDAMQIIFERGSND